jgi:hypothetical protein
MVINPSTLDRIWARAVNANSAETFIGHRDSLKASTDLHETLLQLELLLRSQAKLYANRGKAARIVPEPRFHPLFVRRKAGIHKCEGKILDSNMPRS